MNAAANGNAGAVKTLLELGADINEKEYSGLTALAVCRAEIMKRLLDVSKKGRHSTTKDLQVCTPREK